LHTRGVGVLIQVCTVVATDHRPRTIISWSVVALHKSAHAPHPRIYPKGAYRLNLPPTPRMSTFRRSTLHTLETLPHLYLRPDRTKNKYTAPVYLILYHKANNLSAHTSTLSLPRASASRSSYPTTYCNNQECM